MIHFVKIGATRINLYAIIETVERDAPCGHAEIDVYLGGMPGSSVEGFGGAEPTRFHGGEALTLMRYLAAIDTYTTDANSVACDGRPEAPAPEPTETEDVPF